MTPFNLRLYAPGLDPAGATAQGRFRGRRLVVSAEGGDFEVEVAELRAKAAGYDGQQWLLEWPSAAGPCSALVPDAAAVQALRAQAPAGLAAQLDQAHGVARGRARRFGLGAGLAAAILLLPVVLALAFWLNAARIADWAAGQVSLEQERQLGELAFEQMRPQLKLVDAGPALVMVREIGSRLTTGSRYDYRWHVADDPQVNAFAVPGGHVVVYTGLIKAAASPEEVAGVLAHEVQHIERRHSLQGLLHQLGWRAVLSLALGDLAGGVWAGMADQLGRLEFSRDLEREADVLGLAALKRAGIAPQGMAAFFERMARQDGEALAWLSTHPTSTERLQAIRAAIAAQGDYASAPLAYDFESIKAGP